MVSGEPGGGLLRDFTEPSGDAGPTVLRLLLGAQLRKLREAKHISLEDAGRQIRSSHSKMSRLELGRVGFKDRDLTDLLALYGVASLFGFLRISEILPMVEGHIRGRLLVFFPGVYEQNNYRLLDARDGWNYHAVPITPSEAEARR